MSQDILTLGYFVTAAKYPRILCRLKERSDYISLDISLLLALALALAVEATKYPRIYRLLGLGLGPGLKY